MPRLVRSTTIFALPVFVSLIAGCGGGEAAPSKAAFIKEADSICRQMDAKVLKSINEYDKKHPGIINGVPKEVAAARLATAIALPAIQKEAEDLGALPAPAEDEKKIKLFVSEIEAGVRAANKRPTQTFTSDRGPFHTVSKLGKGYGFTECSEPL